MVAGQDHGAKLDGATRARSALAGRAPYSPRSRSRWTSLACGLLATCIAIAAKEHSGWRWIVLRGLAIGVALVAMRLFARGWRERIADGRR
jgi:hypothetical protein